MNSVSLFEWLAATRVYRDLHNDAVAATARLDETGARWIDVGTGTGLVARAAAAHGYRVTGVDMDERMIAAARRATTPTDSLAFDVGSVMTLAEHSAEVVSAASLLFVVSDRTAAAAALWGAVKPGGRLLIVETTSAMTPSALRSHSATDWTSRDRKAMSMWARARQGHAIDPTALPALTGVDVEFTPLLGGLVGAWVFLRR